MSKERPYWRLQANCYGLPLEMFFGPLDGVLDPSEAISVCAESLVITHCLKYAIRQELIEPLGGIFGGLTHEQRVEIIEGGSPWQ